MVQICTNHTGHYPSQTTNPYTASPTLTAYTIPKNQHSQPIMMHDAMCRIRKKLTLNLFHLKQQHRSIISPYIAKHLHQCHYSTDSFRGDSSQNHRYITITFLTDVEGDGAYFDRFVHHSKVLGFRTREPHFGRYAQNRRHIERGKNDVMELDWNLGEWVEDYFPYDKEVVFLDEGNGDDTSMLVYGVSCCCVFLSLTQNSSLHESGINFFFSFNTHLGGRLGQGWSRSLRDSTVVILACKIS